MVTYGTSARSFRCSSRGALDLGDPALQAHDLLTDAPAVDLELGLAGSARPDAAAAEAREVRPGPGQARQHVLELRQLDLQLAFEAAGAGGEDVEDQLAPVEHLGVQTLGQRPLLAGAEILVDEHDARARRLHGLLELLDLALPDVRGRRDLTDVLRERRDRLDAGGASQPLELAKRLVGADGCAILAQVPVVDADQDRALDRSRDVLRPALHRMSPPTMRVIAAPSWHTCGREAKTRLGKSTAARFSLTVAIGRA
jgi:hypothetical protein